MSKKLDPKDKNYVDKLADNLEGVGFSGSEELGAAVKEVAEANGYSSKKGRGKFFTTIKRLLGLPVKSKDEAND
ncbi:hypothetical protein GF360_01510 [candidate division WWE3 bacterium]|nr:hypothetical protein [candidate division WWE3 bacterium]